MLTYLSISNFIQKSDCFYKQNKILSLPVTFETIYHCSHLSADKLKIIYLLGLQSKKFWIMYIMRR